jgi:hypothetical protein
MSSFRMAFLLLLTIGLLLTGLVQGLTSTFTPLKVYTHTPGSVEDYERACYSSVVEEKGFVKFGSPEGCGKGCQHISSVSSFCLFVFFLYELASTFITSTTITTSLLTKHHSI